MLDITPAQRMATASVLMQPAPLRFIGSLWGKVMGRVYKLTGKDQYDDFLLERIDGVPVLVVPSVCNPKSMRTGAFFASQLDARIIAADAEVLDMGTGSGVCALFAARHARRVVAVDINPAAVRCARVNAYLNDLEARVDVRQGDLFAPVATERFDLILFNPPFLRGTPRNDRDRAWRANDVIERFAAQLGAHLKPRGCALLLLSTFGDAAGFLQDIHNCGFSISVLAERRFINERLAIFRIEPRAAGSAA